MNKRENWAEKFERRRDEVEEFALNIAKKKQLDEYNGIIRKLKEKYSNQNGRDYKAQITILEEMLEVYCKISKLEIEEIEVKPEINKLEENIKYLKFKQQYSEEYHIDEVDVKIARAKSEIQEMYDEEKLDYYRRENSKNKRILKMKEEAERSKVGKNIKKKKRKKKDERLYNCYWRRTSWNRSSLSNCKKRNKSKII